MFEFQYMLTAGTTMIGFTEAIAPRYLRRPIGLLMRALDRLKA